MFWEKEHTGAVQFIYKIIAEAFQVSNDIETREEAVKSGFLDRILTRLGKVTGESARKFERMDTDEENNEEEVTKLSRKKSYTKNTDKKKRKGVGYDTNQGTLFDVAAFADQTTAKNEQIKNLVDIVNNFLSLKGWVPS